MERRIFLLSPLVVLLPVSPVSKELPPREFYRYFRATNRWIKITRYDIKSGDILRVYDPPDPVGIDDIVIVSRVESDQFYTTYKLDKSTNQWV